MFKERDIRPKKAELLANKLRVKDIQDFFLDKKGNVIDKYITESDCPACSRGESTMEFIKEKFRFKRCIYCNTLYVSPRPNPQRLLEYYKFSKSINFFIKHILEKTAEIRKEKIFKSRGERVISYLTNLRIPKKLFVDIGG